MEKESSQAPLSVSGVTGGVSKNRRAGGGNGRRREQDNGRSSSNGRAGREAGTAAGMSLGLEMDSIPTCPFGGTDGHLAPSTLAQETILGARHAVRYTTDTWKWTDTDNKVAV